MTTREDRFNEIVAGMERQIKDHRILAQDNKTILLGNPNGCFNFRCEIISSGGYLIVCGDNDIMCFGGGGKTTVQDKIVWIGRQFSSYVREKAHIGMTGVGCEEFDSDVAADEIRQYMTDPYEDERFKEAWKRIKVRAIEAFPNDSQLNAPIEEVVKLEMCEVDQRELQEIIYDEMEDPEHLDVGVVPSRRLIAAWCLVKKANDLLQEK
jgi:hypothetical protein